MLNSGLYHSGLFKNKLKIISGKIKMPQLPPIKSLRKLCIESIAKDKHTNYDFDGILPEMGMAILNKKNGHEKS